MKTSAVPRPFGTPGGGGIMVPMMGLLLVVVVAAAAAAAASALATTAATAAAAGPRAEASATRTSFELKYFDARGAAETTRLIFALGGEAYVDTRFDITPGTMDSPAFRDAKAGGLLTMNLDRAPVLVVTTEQEATAAATDGNDDDGAPAWNVVSTATLGQSRAIERFLARRYGLMGSSDLEAAQIDCVTEHCRDVKDAQARKRFSAFVRDRSDEDKARDRAGWFETDLPRMLRAIEACVSEETTGCAVGTSLSLADLAIYSVIRDALPAYRDETVAAAQDYPSILEIVEAVENHPKIAAWLKARPESNF